MSLPGKAHPDSYHLGWARKVSGPLKLWGDASETYITWLPRAGVKCLFYLMIGKGLDPLDCTPENSVNAEPSRHC